VGILPWKTLTAPARALFQYLTTALWPDRCLLCGAFLEQPEERGVCRSCLQPAGFGLTGGVCGRCGYPLGMAPERTACRFCREGAFLFDRARSAGTYDRVLRQLIHHYKFEKQARLHIPLARLLADTYHRQFEECGIQAVTHVPLHRRSLRARGFDQSELLARRLARTVGVPHRRLLCKVRATAVQSSLPLEGRAANVRSAYRARRRAVRNLETVLLVDDIFTTGATLNAACRALLEAGVARIHVLTLARVTME
jgi:ComF family protein